MWKHWENHSIGFWITKFAQFLLAFRFNNSFWGNPTESLEEIIVESTPKWSWSNSEDQMLCITSRPGNGVVSMVSLLLPDFVLSCFMLCTLGTGPNPPPNPALPGLPLLRTFQHHTATVGTNIQIVAEIRSINLINTYSTEQTFSPCVKIT